MTRPLTLAGVLAFLLTLAPAGAPAADNPAAGPEDTSVRQLLHEALREMTAMEEGKDELELPDFGELMPGRDGNLPRVSAMRAIGAALASVGDVESARETWQQAVDLASAIKSLGTKAEALLEIAAAQDAAGERGAAAATTRQALQAARLIKEGRGGMFDRALFSPSPLDRKSTLLARIGEVQARLDDQPASEASFRLAREAAEGIEGHLEKVAALVGVASRQDPTGTGSAWDRPLEFAVAPRETLQRILGLDIVLRERIRAGAAQESVRAAEGLKGVTRTHALWIVTDELALAAREGRPVPEAVVERLSGALKGAEYRRGTEKDRALARLAVLQTRVGSTDAASETLKLLESDDPPRAARWKVAAAEVRCAVARRELGEGRRASARGALREALALLADVPSEEQTRADVAQLFAETGDREAALQAADAGPSSAARAEALAGVAAALGKAKDREGAGAALERAVPLVDRIPEETAWEYNSRERETYNDPRKPERSLHPGYLKKESAMKALAIAQATAGDLTAAQRTVESMLGATANDGLFTAGYHTEALQAIAKIQADAGDFGGAWGTASKLSAADLPGNDETRRLLRAIAAGQAAAGDARGAMQAALAQTGRAAKLVALQGMADGIVRRKGGHRARG